MESTNQNSTNTPIDLENDLAGSRWFSRAAVGFVAAASLAVAGLGIGVIAGADTAPELPFDPATDQPTDLCDWVIGGPACVESSPPAELPVDVADVRGTDVPPVNRCAWIIDGLRCDS